MATKSSRVNSSSRPGLLITLLCTGGMLASYMQMLVVPIVGKLGSFLHTSADNASWVVTATLLTAAIAMPISGRIADLYGKRLVILVSLALMLAGSVLCAVVDSLIPVIVGRGLQGMAMGIVPVGISLLRDELPPARIPGAIATMSATLGVGGAIGLPISAWISQNYSWHLLFWTSAAAAAVVFAAVLFFVRESPVRSKGTFDYVGAVGLSVALVCILLALSKGRSWGWTSGLTVGMAIAGLLILAVWVIHQRRQKSPLVNIASATIPRVAMTNFVSVLIGFTMMGMFLATPQLLQIPHIPGVLDFGLGQTIVAAGLWLAPGGLMMLFMSPVSAKLNTTVGPKITLMIGTAIIAAGYIYTLGFIAAPWEVAIAMIITSSGVGVAYSAMPAIIMSSVPLHETASANGLNSLMRSIGTALASALMATFLLSSTVTINGTKVPTESAFHLVFIVGAIAAVIAIVAIALIPKARPESPVPHRVDELAETQSALD